MTTVEGTSSRRHGRRARALDEDSTQHRATSEFAFSARRAAVAPPAADMPLPLCTRFDLAPVAQAPDAVQGTTASDPDDDAPEVAAPSSDVPTEAPEASAAEPQELEHKLPASDRGAKKTSWFGSMLGRGRKSASATREPAAHPAEESAPSETVTPSATGDQGEPETPATLDQPLEDSDAAQTTHEPEDDGGTNTPSPEGGVDGDAVPVAALASVAETDESAESELSDVEGVETGDTAGDVELAEEDHANNEDASAEGDAASSDPWTEEPATEAPENTYAAPASDEARSSTDGSDWYEVGDLPADQAPEPKPAPRFEGQVLNKPSRSATGLGGWVTWVLVFLVLALIIVLFVTGMIGPGLLNSMPAPTTHSLLDAGGLFL